MCTFSVHHSHHNLLQDNKLVADNTQTHRFKSFSTVNPEYFVRTKFLYVRDFRPFVRMKFSCSCWPLRILWLAWAFHTEVVAYEIYENKMHTKCSGYTVPRSCSAASSRWGRLSAPWNQTHHSQRLRLPAIQETPEIHCHVKANTILCALALIQQEITVFNFWIHWAHPEGRASPLLLPREMQNQSRSKN